MSIEVQLGISFRVDGPESAEELAQSAGKVMEALLALEECNSELSDAGVAMDADQMIVEVELKASGASEPESIERALAAVRTAIHAAGHGTPDWQTSSRYATPDISVEGATGTFRRLQFTASVE
ncbi:hypothetical protein Caci_8221 [Catenulispora acidiphila DSM 44928]|uniref:Uncharacterized protein n=1 Tax=Catenulispora acidiphila (strain DSM 44928 / JCM 14897 / NBRC 102108 / NRRL B-24433 / ID139908) TaxID=479433 RepID=C7QIZ4_CATAD|nr:hypothetical protein [Catenulispora acidiphila]ACU77044.1 hypothetical protein Caci_8221 [Catenulispora acidiphila DSM 44928]